ncbi:hypothetical protein EX895_006535 [Sporisorium graminicola]|uniref:Uncharacterized protein n=1 Tax=Sporisorium graminicola TaxID=280036 RepID=A0A4U7KL51_9BASI|nr:hypothetical protein EX895_006535 [Sporisorium graminicola]TKY84633.1 hypothetical protein EX895_006535 [Sporisorium graminicola]
MLPSTLIARTALPRLTPTRLVHRLLREQRTLATTSRRTLAQPPPTSPETEELNEAQRYLANKAARKAQRLRDPTGASARHASLYSRLFPALLRILAYGSSAYFGLHLLWNVLDRDEQTKLMNAQTNGLEATAKSIVEKVERAKEKVEGAAEATVSSKRWYWPF